jgi:hypothetical protein
MSANSSTSSKLLWNNSNCSVLISSGSFWLRKPKALVSGGVSNSLSTEYRCGCGCEGLGLESDLRVRGGVCEARCTNVDHQGYRGLRCGGGEVLQPVERGCVARPLGPASRKYASPFARPLATTYNVVAFFAVDRATPLGTLGIRRARVGWDAEGERRSGLARTGTNCFGHAPEEQQPLDVLKTATGGGAGRGNAVVYTAAMGGPCGRRRVWLWRGSCYNPPCPYSHGGEYTTRGDGVVVVSSGGENERKASQTAPHSSSCSYSFGYGLGIYPLLFSKCHAARCTQHTVCVYWTVSVTSAAVYFIFQWQQEQDMANMANLRS